MHVFMIGLSFKTAPVDVRERVAFSRTVLPDALTQLCCRESIRGAVILSTCNRMEIYVDTVDKRAAYRDICDYVAKYKHVNRSCFEEHLYTFAGLDAVDHLFRVVSSLDSMVLGEQQISGQVRTAYKQAVEVGSCTMILAHLFRQALGCGKKVRNQTSISESHVSISTVAIDLARAEFDTFDDKTVLVIGSGEMSELAARYLRELGVSSFIVSSRTYANARRLACELGGQARFYEELPELISQADIIISSTAAPHCIITPTVLHNIKDHLFILDIALPRDVDPAVGDMPGVTLCDLDDISAQINSNQDARRKAAELAADVVEEEVQEFKKWVDRHAVVPTIRGIREAAEETRKGEVAHLLRRLDTQLSEKDLQALEDATKALVKKILHTPTVRLKKTAENNTSFQAVEAVRYLFGLSEGMVEHSHSMDDGQAAAEVTMPPHASAHHHMIGDMVTMMDALPEGHPDIGQFTLEDIDTAHIAALLSSLPAGHPDIGQFTMAGMGSVSANDEAEATLNNLQLESAKDEVAHD